MLGPCYAFPLNTYMSKIPAWAWSQQTQRAWQTALAACCTDTLGFCEV